MTADFHGKIQIFSRSKYGLSLNYLAVLPPSTLYEILDVAQLEWHVKMAEKFNVNLSCCTAPGFKADLNPVEQRYPIWHILHV